jgi:glycosyltransferase involved in cell wall biosynthesis
LHKLTVLVLAYNVEKYIEECLNSILSQEVTFDYKIYIGNDGSTDGTVSILKKYEKKYPNIVKLFLTNRIPRHHQGDYINFANLYNQVKSEYFCVLDGDDFWTDNLKLKNQITFLDNNKEYTACGHNYYLLTNDGEMTPAYDGKNDMNYKFFTNQFEDVLLGISFPYMQTSSLVYRNIFLDDECVINSFKHHMYKGDFIRTLLHASKGSVKYINKLMSVYRISGNGDWSKNSQKQNSIYHINFYRYHSKYTFCKKYSEAFDEAIIRECINMFNNLPNKFEKIKYIKYWFIKKYYQFKKYNFAKKPTQISDKDFINESYSQHGEDNIVVALFNYKKDGFFVDVGSHHPYRFSNTYKLYKMGWRGINIDALPGSKKIFDELRDKDINVESAVGNNEDYLNYYMFEEAALNTLSENMVAEAYKNYKVKPLNSMKITVKKLSALLDIYLPKGATIDLMNIDVEGLDYDVLLSNDWVKYKPKMIICEIENNDIFKILNSKSYQLLIDLNYRLVSKTVLSCIFILNK